MSTDDKIILDQVLDQLRKDVAPALSEASFFEVFTAGQILKDYDLSYDEISSGIVGAGGDGGIDAFYGFVNGELIQDDSDFTEFRRNIEIEVVIIQSKTATGYTEAAMNRLASSCEDLFDLSKSLPSLQSVYNKALLDAAERFRSAYQALASRFPRLKISLHYATKGEEIHPNVVRKIANIESVVKRHFSSAVFEFQFLGAKNLLDLARRTPKTTYELKLAENPISSTGNETFVCLVSLGDFCSFITDAQGHLVRNIFEANVRDYQGKTQVNEQIQDTLVQRGIEDFWWLNNGITVLAGRATLSGKTITLETPEIVNGLQTSTEIYTYFRGSNTENESRNVLVRVIVPNSNESRDRIIRATNSQTAIPPASLRSTDRIHRNIEEYLKPFGLFYDRRKNFHKNEGKPISKIISIPQMAQAVMAIVLRQPDTARARPSSLIKKDEEYDRLFDAAYPIEIYRACAEILKRTESYLSSLEVAPSAADRNNMKFYVAMVASQEQLRSSAPTARMIADLAGVQLGNEVLEAAFELVNGEYVGLGATDQVAKGSELKSIIERKLDLKFSSQWA